MDFIKQLKEQINIAEVVGEYVRLRKTGSNHMGLCPFHAERSPSFSVAEKKGIFHCFGCQRSGDVISFIQDVQGVSFHEAIRILAQKYSFKLPPEFASRQGGKNSDGSSVEDKQEVYFKLNRFVAQFYHEKLIGNEGKAAREYLYNRGVTDQMIKTAYLGYAPSAWADLYDFLNEKKAPLDKAEELGLIRKKGTGADATGRAHYDLFRNRVMFPVVDTRGRVIAFGGRALGDEEGPKYLNSSESPVFKKGNHLFGIFAAQKDIRAEDFCVVVEGFMDCLSLQQAGIGYTVATLGTALTERQVSILKRFTKNIVVLFDGDAAGQEAQARAMETFLNEDVVVRGVSLTDQYDPDEFVREKGADALVSLLKHAPFILDQKIMELVTAAGAQAEARARAIDQILPWIAKVSSDTSRLVRLQEISSIFDVNLAVLERRVGEIRGALPKAKPAMLRGPNPNVALVAGSAPAFGSQLPRKPISTAAIDSLDAKLIEYLVTYSRFFDAELDVEALLLGVDSESVRKLVSKLLAEADLPSLSSEELLAKTDEPELKAVIRRALVMGEQQTTQTKAPASGEQTIEQIRLKEIQDLEHKLMRRGLERRRDQLRLVIRKADGSGEVKEVSKLMTEYNELVRRLDETKGGPIIL